MASTLGAMLVFLGLHAPGAGAATLDEFTDGSAIAPAPDGGYYVAGATSPCTAPQCGPRREFVARFDAAGSPVATFGEGGFAFGPSRDDTPDVVSLEATPTGPLVSTLGVRDTPTERRATIRRFTAAGVPDPSFGSGGALEITAADFGATRFTLAATTLDSVGRLVVVGTAYGPGFTQDLAVARFLANGTPDPSFGMAGMVRTTLGSQEPGGFLTPSDVATGAGDSIRILGSTGLYYVNVAGLEADGDPDPAFGGDGSVTVFSMPPAAFLNYPLPDELEFDPAGRLVVAGHNPGGYKPCGYMLDARLLANGDLDTSFGDGGRLGLVESLRCANETELALAPDGGFVNATSVDSTLGSGLGVLRGTGAGALDAGFGNKGSKVFQPPRAVGRVGDVLVDGAGRIVLAGTAGPGAGTSSSCFGQITTACTVIALARLGADGSLDPSFGEAGVSLVPRISTCQVEGLRVRIRVAKRKLRIRATVRYETEGGPSITLVLSKERAYRPSFTKIGKLNVRRSRSGRAVFSSTGRIAVWLLRHPGRGLTLLPREAGGRTPRGVCNAIVRLRRVKSTKDAIFYAGRSAVAPG